MSTIIGLVSTFRLPLQSVCYIRHVNGFCSNHCRAYPLPWVGLFYFSSFWGVFTPLTLVDTTAPKGTIFTVT